MTKNNAKEYVAVKKKTKTKQEPEKYESREQQPAAKFTRGGRYSYQGFSFYIFIQTISLKIFIL